MSLLTIEKNYAPRGGYILRAECVLPQPLEQVFPFFSDAFQLETITPPWMHFSVQTPKPIDMHVGQIIDYKLRVRGIPLRWQSEISAWEPPYRFIDEARRSPYNFWHHEHLFEECEAGTRVIDIVHYDVPGGALVHSLFVKRDIEKIFRFRQETLERLFPTRSEARQEGEADEKKLDRVAAQL